MGDYRTVNRASWDERAVVHAASPFCGLDRLVEDPTALSPVVLVFTGIGALSWLPSIRRVDRPERLPMSYTLQAVRRA